MHNRVEMHINHKTTNRYNSKRESETLKIQAILVNKKLKEIIKINLI